MPGRPPTPSRAIGLVVTALLSAVSVACAHAGPAPARAASTRIDLNTPQGVRAQQTMDMLNSDWPIGTFTVGTLATQRIVDPVTVAMDRLWWDRPISTTGIDVGAGTATLHVVNSYSVAQDIELRTDADGLVDRFEVRVRKPVIKSWQDVDATIARSGAHYSYQASRVSGGNCTAVAGTHAEDPLPLASIFKLYVLLAVADAVNASALRWDDRLTITARDKAVGSAGFDELSPGETVSVRDAAQQMISKSDNMATDMLINRLGPGAVERALKAGGHHDPAAMTPFPTAHEMFSVGWGAPDVRGQWQSATARDRAQMLHDTNVRPYEPDPQRTHAPASPYGIEWYGTAGDICRVHAALQVAARGPAAPVRDILSATPGIDLPPSKWRYVAAKGGNLPGDLTFSWYAEDRTGQGWVVSFQLSWPSYRSLAAATWLLGIATGAFGLLPVG